MRMFERTSTVHHHHHSASRNALHPTLLLRLGANESPIALCQCATMKQNTQSLV